MKAAVSFLAGMVFAVGLALAGMTDANKVLAFLNVLGAWDPSLAFVMGGAIAVHLPLYELAVRRGRPWLAAEFFRPATTIDLPLIGGAALFGAGWGLSGFCPGPALVSLVTLQAPVLVFVGAMTAGMALWHVLAVRAPSSAHVTTGAVQ